MSTATATMDNPSLVFARSESKTVGMHGTFVDMLRSNSARIAGGMKLVADMFFGFSGDPLLIAYSVFSITGRLLLIAFGTKENQQKQLAKEKHEDVVTQPEAGALTKIVQPHKYPVESSTGLSLVAESLYVGYGISQVSQGKGITGLLVGLSSLLMYGLMLFGKERKQQAEKSPSEKSAEATDELVFAQSESKQVGWLGKLRQTLKDNPVLASSLIGMAISSTNLIGSIIEGNPMIAIGAAIFLSSFIFQAIFMRKKEFNIEGAREDQRAAAEQSQLSHADRIVQQKQQRGPWEQAVGPL